MLSKLLAFSRMKLFILTLFIFYITGICSSFFRIREINMILSLLQKYIDSLSIKNLSLISKEQIQQSPSHQETLNDVLLYYPAILKYDPCYVDVMGYGQSHLQNYRAAIAHYNNLLMKRNFLIQELEDSFNPFTTIKKIFCIPSTVIEWIGFTPKDMFSKLLNMFIWLGTLFLNLYSDELESFIKLLIHHLFYT